MDFYILQIVMKLYYIYNFDCDTGKFKNGCDMRNSLAGKNGALLYGFSLHTRSKQVSYLSTINLDVPIQIQVFIQLHYLILILDSIICIITNNSFLYWQNSSPQDVPFQREYSISINDSSFSLLPSKAIELYQMVIHFH